MTNLLLETETEESIEARVVHVGARPISFERFLGIASDRFVELVDGVIVEKPTIQLDHELCTRWLYQVLGPYVRKINLGLMLSSRNMVKSDDFGGRMDGNSLCSTVEEAGCDASAISSVSL